MKTGPSLNVTSTLEERLRILRKSHGVAIGLPDLPAAQFAALAGIAPSAYLAFEAGEREPSIAALAALRRLTGVSLDWLIEGDEPAEAVRREASCAVA